MNSKKKSFLMFPLLIFILAFIGPWVAPFSPSEPHLEDALIYPNQIYWLGADSNGRDILSQILYGTRTSLGIGLIVVAICSITGTLAGFIAGYWGGILDRVFLFMADVFQAFPGMLLAIAIAAFLPPNARNLILLLSFVGWVAYARVVRAQVIEMRSREFIQAGIALGLSRRRLLCRHFLPNMMGPLIVQSSFGMAGVILTESTLSFLGLGLPEHVPSLGKLMDQGVGLLLVAPHVAFFPGLILMLFVFVFNLTGDRLREKWV